MNSRKLMKISSLMNKRETIYFAFYKHTNIWENSTYPLFGKILLTHYSLEQKFDSRILSHEELFPSYTHSRSRE